MSDTERLDPEAVRQAGIDDWRQIVGRIKARFRTGDFATGLEFVNRIGAAAEAANHHPDIALSYPEVIVTLSSHDVGAITRRDIDLAGTISTIAAELGVGADVAGLTEVELGMDTADGARLAPYYAALLGGRVDDGATVDPSGQVPGLWWQEPSDEGPALPDQSFPQRWHLDVWVPHDEAEGRLRAVLDAGGHLVSDAAAPSFWVIEDVDGNRSCICSTAGR